MTFLIFRSSRSEVFCKNKVSLEIAQSSQGNTYSRVSFLIKLQACALLIQRLWHRCFPVNFAKFLRTPFLTNTSAGRFCSVSWSLKNVYPVRICRICTYITVYPEITEIADISLRLLGKIGKTFLKYYGFLNDVGYFEIIFFSFVLYLNDY